jgi:hypothetical protein
MWVIVTAEHESKQSDQTDTTDLLPKRHVFPSDFALSWKALGCANDAGHNVRRGIRGSWRLESGDRGCLGCCDYDFEIIEPFVPVDHAAFDQ